ncbi:MAG: hypothetical protein ED859_14845 [Desulfuromonadales bacterium]|nr:MAG: hypothetical protein ED859_14845 [Desulfuromonadales bacterium]
MARVAMIVVRAGVGRDVLRMSCFMGPVGIQTQLLQDVGAAVDARKNQLHGEDADDADGWK